MPQDTARKQHIQPKTHKKPVSAGTKPLDKPIRSAAENEIDAAKSRSGVSPLKLTPAALRRGVILSEILGKPVALRNGGRR